MALDGILMFAWLRQHMGRTLAHLVVNSLAGVAFGIWQGSPWAGVALGVTLWAVLVLPRGDAP